MNRFDFGIKGAATRARNSAFALSTLSVSCACLAGIYACSSSNGAAPSPTLTDSGGSPPADASSSGSSDGSSDGASSDAASDGTTADSADSGAPPCSSLPGTIVYIESGDTQEPILKLMGRQLRDTADITIVFWLTGSCSLTPALYDGTPIAAGQVMDYIPSTVENPGWTTANAESTCTITTPTQPQLGISALYPASCELGGPEAGSSIGLINGPIQAYTFIVPPSTFGGDGMAITAQEANAAFGAHKGGGLVTYNGTPEWNDPSQMFFRPTTKSTLVSTAFNIQLTATVMAQGAMQEASSSDVLSAVSTATSFNAIGILGDEVFDTQGRSLVDVLAFQAFGQNAAYFPDSTQTAFDRQNIRDGHYTMWSPTVYITDVDSGGEPTNPAIKYITDTVTGNAAALPPEGGTPIDGLADIATVGLTPGCAMQVTRSSPIDGSQVVPSSTAPSCTCYFLSRIPGATATPPYCTTCSSTDAACGTGQTCIRGYCEGEGAGIPPVVGDGGAGCTGTVGPNSCTNAQAISKTGVVILDGGT